MPYFYNYNNLQTLLQHPFPARRHFYYSCPFFSLLSSSADTCPFLFSSHFNPDSCSLLPQLTTHSSPFFLPCSYLLTMGLSYFKTKQSFKWIKYKYPMFYLFLTNSRIQQVPKKCGFYQQLKFFKFYVYITAELVDQKHLLRSIYIIFFELVSSHLNSRISL